MPDVIRTKLTKFAFFLDSFLSFGGLIMHSPDENLVDFSDIFEESFRILSGPKGLNFDFSPRPIIGGPHNLYE
jgi:hypothetical protein